jgi:thiol-disulfide isomerase/thioredoxin
MNQILLTIATLISINAFAARLTDGKVTTKIEKDEIRLTVMSGFHFNAQAPASAKFDQLGAPTKPTKKTEKLFAFKIPKDVKTAHLSFYVCDDKKTVCEQQQSSIDLMTAQVSQTEKKSVEANYDKVTSLESVDGKPTLLIFSAPWCPACIRMQTETYPVASVAKELNKIHFKKVNSDLVENYDLAEKFHIKAIPTHILLNAKGEEVYRWLDFQAANTFGKSLAAETKKLAEDNQNLQAKAAQGDLEAISQLGMREYNSLNCAEAIKWLSISKKTQDQKFKLAAEVSCAEKRQMMIKRIKKYTYKRLKKECC